MANRFADTDSAVMTHRTVRGINVLVTELCRNEGFGAMTHGTIFRRWQVPEKFTNRDHIVMAGFTVTGNAGMIERTRAECTRGMTDAAILIRRHMIERLADRGDSMAGRAVIHDTGVVKHRADETGGVMTDTAIFGCCNMVCGFSDRIDAVITGVAVCARL